MSPEAFFFFAIDFDENIDVNFQKGALKSKKKQLFIYFSTVVIISN